MSVFHSLRDKLLHLFYPKRCTFCGKVLPDSQAVCPECAADLPWVEDEQELDPAFRQYILDFPGDQLPRIYELVDQYRETRNITVFHSREEADRWIERQSPIPGLIPERGDAL